MRYVATKADNSLWRGEPIDHGLKPKSLKRIPSVPPANSIPSVAMLAREYLRCLRAAEMAAWEITGGDYALSRFARQSVPTGPTLTARR